MTEMLSEKYIAGNFVIAQTSEFLHQLGLQYNLVMSSFATTVVYVACCEQKYCRVAHDYVRKDIYIQFYVYTEYA